jgi:hypothetical protein
MAACVGDDPDETLDVMIGQLVKIVRDGEELRLSKRAGTIVTLDELVAEIGVDALRYSLARYPADSPLVLDVEEITRASNDNPVYYVQYAHARTCRMMENAADLGMSVEHARETFDPALLSHERDRELLRPLPTSRASSPEPRSSASRTGSRATSWTPPRCSTSGTTRRSAACSRPATSRSPRPTRPGSCSSSPLAP